MSIFFDVAIIGGGPAGSAAALTLSDRRRKVLLLEPTTERKKVGESLPAAARPLLAHLGVEYLLKEGPHLISFGNSSAWGSDEIVTVDSISNPHGSGWHLDRARFDRDLRVAAKKRGVAIKKARAKKLKKLADGWEISLETGKVKARWLIDVSGRSAWVAGQVGVQRRRDDNLVAIYAWLSPKKSDRDTRTLVESASDGWWYTSRLPDQSRIVAFHTDVKSLSTYRAASRWKTALAETRHVKKVLGALPKNLKLSMHEACGSELRVFWGEGWIAAGDAALSFDPLSSQGIFNALYTGMKSAEAVDKSLDGEDRLLKDYAEELKSIRKVYLARHRMFYRQEQRWREKDFWKSRSKAE